MLRGTCAHKERTWPARGESGLSRQSNKDRDGHALLDVEDILVAGVRRRRLWPYGVPVEVQDVDLVERLRQRFAHSSVSDPVDVAVVRDEGQDSGARSLDPPLSEADELDVVVVEIQFLFVQILLVVL
jgi:hypothetical protein